MEEKDPVITVTAKCPECPSKTCIFNQFDGLCRVSLVIGREASVDEHGCGEWRKRTWMKKWTKPESYPEPNVPILIKDEDDDPKTERQGVFFDGFGYYVKARQGAQEWEQIHPTHWSYLPDRCMNDE